MKKLLIATMILGSAFAQAATVTVLETTVLTARSGDRIDDRFYIDTTTGQGSVTVTVTREEYNPWDNQWPGGGWTNCTPYGGCIPRPMPRPMPTIRTIFDTKVEVTGLALHGDRIVYAGTNGDVECGTFGYSSVLRRPTIYLSGKCTLNSYIDRDGRLTTTMTTK